MFLVLYHILTKNSRTNTANEHLELKAIELLVCLDMFNDIIMNDAVYKFKRYDDSGLEYAGISKHTAEDIGLFDTVISMDDYEMM